MSGRHRQPSTHGHTAARLALVGGVAVAPLAAGDVPAMASTLDEIAACESSGDPRAIGPVTKEGGHFGLFQFDLATWASVGGTGNPINASAAEQRSRAAVLLARRGTQPWLASQACWTKRGAVPVRAGASPLPSRTPAGVRTPAPAPRGAPAPPHGRLSGPVTVRPGDTLSGIAREHATTWQRLWQANRAVVANPDVIFPGERLNLP